MKRLIKLTMVCMTLVMFTSCERVAPNYVFQSLSAAAGLYGERTARPAAWRYCS